MNGRRRARRRVPYIDARKRSNLVIVPVQLVDATPFHGDGWDSGYLLGALSHRLRRIPAYRNCVQTDSLNQNNQHHRNAQVKVTAYKGEEWRSCRS